MLYLLSSSVRSLTSLMRLAIGLVIVVMLLLSPLARAHDFGTHFRNPEVKRSTARHTFAAHSHENTPERIAQNSLRLVALASIVTDRQITVAENFDAIPHLPLVRMLKRLKLNPAAQAESDPLL